jgi:hypothetical protein
MKSAGFKRIARFAALAGLAIAASNLDPRAAFAHDLATHTASLSYADLADLTDRATIVVKAQIRKTTKLGPENSPGLRPGWIRLLIEARAQSIVFGRTGVSESIRYLADVPLDPKGKVPKLNKLVVLLYGLPVEGRPGELQLVTPDAMLVADPASEERARAMLAEFIAPDAAPRITGVREALSVNGNLDGESETQLFIETESGEPVSISVLRRPGMATEWGVSWSELIDQSAQAPRSGTLRWYRLACSLPPALPPEAIISRDGAGRVLASQDYALVIGQLGPCGRNRQYSP